MSEQTVSSPWMSTMDVADYLQTSVDYVYRLIHRRAIPFSRPSGKLIFIHRDDLEQWLMEHRVMSHRELEAKAANHGKQR